MTLSRFLRSPLWLAGHVVVLVAVVSFVSLGLWQLERLETRRAFNDLLAARTALEAAPLAALDPDDVEANAYRRVTITGTYRHDGEVLLSTRSQDGRPGHHVLTPLQAGDTTVIVDRGWVPLDSTSPPITDAAPPGGEVALEGILFPSQEARRSGAFDGGDGALQFVTAPDLQVLSAALDTPLYPLFVLAQEQTPAQPGVLPVTAEPPALSEGSHRSYAVQWLLFALVVLIGYPMLLRRTYLDQRDDRPGGDPPATGESPPAAASTPVATG